MHRQAMRRDGARFSGPRLNDGRVDGGRAGARHISDHFHHMCKLFHRRRPLIMIGANPRAT
jgi:hypothetical protein